MGMEYVMNKLGYTNKTNEVAEKVDAIITLLLFLSLKSWASKM